MKDLISLYLFATLLARKAHNIVTGSSFFGDHQALKGFYEAYQDAYDALTERCIGLKFIRPEEINKIIAKGCDMMDGQNATDSEALFASLDEVEAKILESIKEIRADMSDGVQNLLQGLADDSEQRRYFIGQRLGNTFH